MTIKTKDHCFTLDIDLYHFLVLLGDKMGKSIVNEIATPDFSIIVRPSERQSFKKEGDYNIFVVKDSGEEVRLDMPHRGAKMFYILTLLCQKAVGGLPNMYFKNKSAAAAIEALFDKLYRWGGEEWVDNSANNKHYLSTYRTHSKDAVRDNIHLDHVQHYWCGFEDEKRTIGRRQLQLRRIRIPSDRIFFEDADNSQVTFEQIIEQLPPFEDLFGF